MVLLKFFMAIVILLDISAFVVDKGKIISTPASRRGVYHLFKSGVTTLPEMQSR